MKIAVTDANIFIDLIEVDLFHFLFELGLEIHTTKSVFDQLNSEQQNKAKSFIQSKSLIIYSFSYEELLSISLIDFPSGLEPADQSVYYYSKKIEAIILTGDKKLRTYCEGNLLEVRGIIWVFDNFVEQNVLSKRVAASKLQLLAAINNRLPLDECNKRISKWNSE